jgi:exonuclease III
MQLKFATWNMAYWSHNKSNEVSWEYMLNSIDADFYLIQESRPPDNTTRPKNLIWHEIEKRGWGNGIASNVYPLSPIEVETPYYGSLVVAEAVINDDTTFTLISLYGLLEYIGKTGYAITTLHRMLSDLTGILNGHCGGKRKIVIGGDLNASIQCDIEWGGKAHDILFQRLDDFKLKNCFEPFYNDFVQTLRHPKSEHPWQNDYFFISNTMKKNLKYCEVIDNESVRTFSDHNPLIITLDI